MRPPYPTRNMRPKPKECMLFALTQESLEAVGSLPSGSIDLRSLKRGLEVIKKDDAENYKENIKNKYASLKIVTQQFFQDREIQNFPLELQNVYQLIEKLETACDVHSVSIQDLSDTIRNWLQLTPTKGMEEAGYAVWSYGTSVDEFYLKWITHVGVSQLLSAWLTAAATQNTLSRLSAVQVGQIVLVESDLDENWYRAKVLEVRSTHVVRFLYIDFGNTEFNYVDRVREIPKEILWIPPFAFRAKLYDLNIRGDKLEGISVLNFLTAVRTTRTFECKIKNYDESNGIAKVRIRRNDLVSFTDCMNDIKCSTTLEEDVFPYHDDHPLSEEIPLLKYRNEEIQLFRRPPTDTTTLLTFVITHFVDPSELYLRILNESEQQAFEALQTSMVEFYDSDAANQMKIKTIRVLNDRIYAWRNPKTNFWERVMVVRVDTGFGTAVTRRVDFGNLIITSLDDMMEISPSFCRVPPFVQPAHLIHLKPSGDRNYWMAEEVAEIKRVISLGRSFHGLVLSTSAEAYDSTYDWKSLGVILTFADEPTPFTVQALLLERGVGIGTGIGVGSSFFLSNLASWVLTAGQYRDTASTERKTLNNGHNMFWGSALSTAKEENDNISVNVVIGDVEELNKMGKLRIVEQDLLNHRIPSLMRQKMGWIEFSHIIGPGHFYVQMKHTLPFLALIMRNVEEKACDLIVEEHEIRRGEFFGASFRHDGLNEISFTESWNRVFVLKYNSSSKHAQVLLVDFGSQASIHKDRLRKLPEFFTYIPPFCQRCHLSSPGVIPSTGKKWTSSANAAFKKYLKDYSVEFPVYFAYQTSRTDKAKLHRYDQEMVYKEEKWEPENGCSYSENDWMVEYRRHPLLHHLFYSYGISVDYEVGCTGTKVFDFQPVWDALPLHGYAMTPKKIFKPVTV